jgi:hypothetical protein
MSIVSQDGLISALGSSQKLFMNKQNVTAVTGRVTSLWTPAGQPGAGSLTLGQATAGAVPTSASVGAMPFVNPAGGVSSYLGRVAGISGASGLIMLMDVLWVWGSGGSGWSVTTTTAQNTSSPAAQTRPDANGTNTEAWLEVLATMGAGASTPVLGYTNSQGTASHTTPAMNPAYAASSVIGSMYNFPLQAGDDGIKTVQSLTLSVSAVSGTARVIIARRLAEIPCQANQGFLLDSFDLGMPQVYDSACLMAAFSPNSTVSGPLILGVSLAQG